MANSKKQAIQRLNEAYKNRGLTLFLGAGVSISNNLPSWENLVLSMYFLTISEQKLQGWRPYSNYLYAISEWFLENSVEPLEITARKLRKYYEQQSGDDRFMQTLHQVLYGNHLMKNGRPSQAISKRNIRNQNSTLDSIAKLCENRRQGINSVITYNYDNLLEIALGGRAHKSIFRADQKPMDKLPIYHVHGYIPASPNLPRSDANEIVFTEDQYNQVSNNSYHWSNIIQIQAMTNSVSLMIGLSLSDRNIRRLFDAVRNTPINTTTYAILKTPDKLNPKRDDVAKINSNAIDLLMKFPEGGIKDDFSGESILFPNPGITSLRPGIKTFSGGQKGPRYEYEIKGIIKAVYEHVRQQQEFVLNQLGITPIWVKEFSEIPEIVNKIIR